MEPGPSSWSIASFQFGIRTCWKTALPQKFTNTQLLLLITLTHLLSFLPKSDEMFAKTNTFAITALLLGAATLSVPLDEKMETRESQLLWAL